MDEMKGYENRKKAVYFKESGRKVHISTKKKFYNGIIIDIRDDFLILIDEKVGELPVFWEEIRYIDPFKEVSGYGNP